MIIFVTRNFMKVYWVVQKVHLGASLVIQWLRICLPRRRVQVWSLVQADFTCQGATTPMCRTYWAHALELVSSNYWSVQDLGPGLCNRRSHHGEKHTTTTRDLPFSPQPKKASMQLPKPIEAKKQKQNKQTKIPASSFRFFHGIVQKIPNRHFGQSDNISFIQIVCVVKKWCLI